MKSLEKNFIKSIKKIRSPVIYLKKQMVEFLSNNASFVPAQNYGSYLDKTYPILNVDGKISKKKMKIREMKSIANGEIGTIYGKEIRIIRED